MLLDTDRDKNVDLIGEKVSIFCRTHIAVGHRIQGGRPGPLRLPSAAASGFPLHRITVACSPAFCISADELCGDKKACAACIKCLSD